jgi:hypothetical protein
MFGSRSLYWLPSGWPRMSSPWLLPGIFGVLLMLLSGMAYLVRAGIRTWNRMECWRCGAAKVRPSKSRSSDTLAGMFLLRPYRCGGCLARFYGFRTFSPGVPEPAAIPAASTPIRKSPLRIRVKVIVRLPWPTDWQSAWELLLAEEQGFLASPPPVDRQRARTDMPARY